MRCDHVLQMFSGLVTEEKGSSMAFFKLFAESPTNNGQQVVIDFNIHVDL